MWEFDSSVQVGRGQAGRSGFAQTVRGPRQRQVSERCRVQKPKELQKLLGPVEPAAAGRKQCNSSAKKYVLLLNSTLEAFIHDLIQDGKILAQTIRPAQTIMRRSTGQKDPK
ncbi:hypothetical protein MRX96_034109 [Rhipicephalus microplus]